MTGRRLTSEEYAALLATLDAYWRAMEAGAWPFPELPTFELLENAEMRGDSLVQTREGAARQKVREVRELVEVNGWTLQSISLTLPKEGFAYTVATRGRTVNETVESKVGRG